MLSDESDTELESPDREDVPDHRSRSRSPLGQDESAPGGASPVRRGRKPNRPKLTKQKKRPDVELDNLEFILHQQEKDDVLREILKFKLEGRENQSGKK